MFKTKTLSNTIKLVTLTVVPSLMISLPSLAELDNNAQYCVFLGHDGHPDPDDNTAQLAGGINAIHNASADNKMTICGLIYGDTQQKRKNGMLSGGPNSNDKNNNDNKGKANYDFFKEYGKGALTDIGIHPIFDITTEKSNFNTSNLAALSSGGKKIAQTIQKAIDNNQNKRIVYSAGGGQNAAAEAIAYLLKNGYTANQIKARFAIVQHSGWNAKNATEPKAQDITQSYTIRIEDQNTYVGSGSIKFYADSARTGKIFAEAFQAARDGTKTSGIPNHKGMTDVSDGGSHNFATTRMLISQKWNNRAGSWWKQNKPSQAIKHNKYTADTVKRDITCLPASICNNSGATTNGGSTTESGENTAPTVVITSPSNNATFRANENIIVKANIGDDNSVLKARFFLKGQFVGADSTAPYSYNFGKLSRGTHEITVEGVDSPEKLRTQKKIVIKVQ